MKLRSKLTQLEAFDPSTSKKKWGFSLIEVLIIGCVITTFFLGGSAVINQGLTQIEQRQEFLAVCDQIDLWMSPINRNEGDSSVNLGSYQKQVFLYEKTSLLKWEAKASTTDLSVGSFQLGPPAFAKKPVTWQSTLSLYRL